MGSENPLRNAKHEAVLQAYFAAADRVGYKAYLAVYPKSSDAAAKTAFSRLLRNADFAGRLRHLDAAITEKVVDDSVMSAREVLQELSKLGRSSIKDVIIAGETTAEVVQSLRDMAPEFAATIQELTVETYVEGGLEDAREVKRVKVEDAREVKRVKVKDAREVKRVKVKLHDKRGPLRDLAQHHKLLTEKHEHAGRDGGPIETVDRTERSDLDIARRIAFVLAKAARATIAGGAAPDKAEDSHG